MNLRDTYTRINKQYKREIEILPERESKMYISMFIFMLLTFIGLGTKPQYDKYIERKAYNTALKEHKANLEERLAKITTLEGDLKKARPYLAKFDTVMPQYSNIEDYLTAIVNAAAEARFVLTNLTANPIEGGISVSLKFTGYEDLKSIDKLSEKLESLQRITTVESINTTFEVEETNATVTVIIYSLESLQTNTQ